MGKQQKSQEKTRTIKKQDQPTKQHKSLSDRFDAIQSGSKNQNSIKSDKSEKQTKKPKAKIEKSNKTNAKKEKKEKVEKIAKQTPEEKKKENDLKMSSELNLYFNKDKKE